MLVKCWLVLVMIAMAGNAQAFRLLGSAGGLTVQAVEIPGPSPALFANPPYVCSNNRYVSPTGTSGNNGLTVGAPWNIATAVAYAAPPGTCINLADGTYNSVSGSTLSHGGNAATPAGWVVWRGTTISEGVPGAHIIGAATGGTLFQVTAAYLWIDGLWVDGNNAAVRNACFAINDGFNGDGTTIHHIWVSNSIIEGCGQANMQFNATEWLFVIHNVIRHGAFNPAFVVASGYSVYQPWKKAGYTPTTCSSNCAGNQKYAYDNYWCSTAPWAFCYQIVTNFNVFYNNYNPTNSTDGEGYEHDAWGHGQNAPNTPYSGNSLDMGNIFYFNGGRGLQMFQDGSAGTQLVVNNTAYNNNMDTTTTNTFRAEIQVNDGNGNVKLINNVAYAITGSGALTANRSYLSKQSTGGNVWQNNIGFPAGIDFDAPDTYPTTGPPNGNLNGANPRFVNATPGTWATHTPGNANFALCTGTDVPVPGCVASPAIGFGQAFSLWQQAPVDAGACHHTATTCP